MPRFTLAVLFFAVSAAAQTATTPSPLRVETTVSLGVAAQLTASRVLIQDVVATQGLDPSAAVVGTIRQSFAPWLGYTVNLGFTRTTEVNTPYSGSVIHDYAIPTNMYETSLAYHLQNRLTPKLIGFVDFGAGALTFLPVHRGADAKDFVPAMDPTFVSSVTFRPVGVALVGVDYGFTHHIAIRAEYRGLLYRYPDFAHIVGHSLTITSQPTVSLVYRFGRKH